MSTGRGIPWTAPRFHSSLSPSKPFYHGHLIQRSRAKALEPIFLDPNLSFPPCCVTLGLLTNFSVLQTACLSVGGIVPMPQGCCENEVS